MIKLPRFSWSLALAGATALGLSVSSAFAADPIKIAVIAEAQAIAGASIPQAAQLAADEINAKGGVNGRKIEIVTYDNHSSSADSVRAFQRAVNEDKVNAVISSYISEVVLALEPWAARLKTVLITPGAASNEITKAVHKDYDKNKYTFHGYLTSASLALSVCDAAKDLLVDGKHMKTAVIMSEDAAWTKPLDVGYEECLPKIGLKVLDHIRFSPDTTDFTPIFNKIEASKPDVIITGISHVGVQPTVQWKNQQVPIPMFGISSQATNETFGKDTNGAADGVLYQGVSGPGLAITPKSLPFADAFRKKYGNFPSYCGYTAYDEVYYIADAIKRAGSTDSDKLVAALEKTDWEGTIGRVQFYGKDNQFTHGLKYGKGLITGAMLQWQDGKQVPVWPKEVAKAQLKFPSFIKLTSK
ncbi:MAG TPA: ABC transporter substrate-binding protein [Nitrobacter sp.]|nr:ABC transporter substrate-binding protein [Nitrobacter sp.]